MLNIDKVDTVYLACGSTDLRKSIDGLTLIVQMELNLNPFDKALFVFCNKQIDKLNYHPLKAGGLYLLLKQLKIIFP